MHGTIGVAEQYRVALRLVEKRVPGRNDEDIVFLPNERLFADLAAPAALELIDLSGRRVQRKELGLLFPGRYTLPLPLETHLRPGLYFLKLDHPSRHVPVRVCIIH